MWVPEPVDTSGVQLPAEVESVLEILAANAHSVWGRERMRQSWRHGPVRDDVERTHSMLLAYREIPDEERHMDRLLVTETLKTLVKLGFGITPPPAGPEVPA